MFSPPQRLEQRGGDFKGEWIPGSVLSDAGVTHTGFLTAGEQGLRIDADGGAGGEESDVGADADDAARYFVSHDDGID
ncbi:hypothetical protein RUND412_008379, partial [Rhizina undulata]